MLNSAAHPLDKQPAGVAAEPLAAKSPAAEREEPSNSDERIESQPPESSMQQAGRQPSIVQLRFLVRRREAGALIGKRGANIKRLRESFKSSILTIPDTGNGPERVVCIATDAASLDEILTDLAQTFKEKSPENDDQIELKLLIHSSHAGSIIGLGGQAIKKLRNVSRSTGSRPDPPGAPG